MFALLKLIPLRDWCYIMAVATLMLGSVFFIAHERHIGAMKCQLDVAQAQNEAQAKHAALQAKLDHQAASFDAALRAAANAVPSVVPKVAFDSKCKLTQAQLDAVKETLK